MGVAILLLDARTLGALATAWPSQHKHCSMPHTTRLAASYLSCSVNVASCHTEFSQQHHATQHSLNNIMPHQKHCKCCIMPHIYETLHTLYHAAEHTLRCAMPHSTGLAAQQRQWVNTPAGKVRVSNTSNVRDTCYKTASWHLCALTQILRVRGLNERTLTCHGVMMWGVRGCARG